MDRSSRNFWLRCITFAAAVAACPSTSEAQSTIAYRDGDGRWQWIQTGAEASFATKADAADETVGVFTVTYEDLSFETGVGFDDPDSGAARRETLRDVLLYVTSVLDVPGTADLLIRTSQTDGRGSLAAAGPYLFPVTGFQGGLVFEHLTTGMDPLPNELDGTLTVDFGFRWSTDPAGPSRTELDLHSTLLHEVTHALGFVSVVGPDGASALGNQGGLGLFSLFDSFLVLGSTGEPLFLAGGEIDASAQDVTSGAVLFAGPQAEAAFGSFPPVYAPNPFSEGSSMGHWSFSTGADAVMLPGIGPGERRREYKAWELQTLADLGYEVVAAPSMTDAGVPDPPGGGIPDAGIPDASIPDSGEPGDGLTDGGMPSVAEPPAVPSRVDVPDAVRSDDDVPTAASPAAPAGCAVTRTSSGWTWPALLALLLTGRRLTRRRR